VIVLQPDSFFAGTHSKGTTNVTQYSDENRGALFSNRDKKRDDKDPDYTGKLNVGGREFWLNAWLKESKAGQKYLSISVKRKDEAKPAKTAAPHDSEIPF
jgi:hypothetical protein